MINIITGLVAAALSSADSAPGGGASLGLDVLIATGVAFTISFELSVLLTDVPSYCEKLTVGMPLTATTRSAARRCDAATMRPRCR